MVQQLDQFGVTATDYKRMRTALSKQFGKEADPDDVAWGLMNEVVQKTRNYNDLKGLYYQMALHLNARGKEFYPILLQARRTELLSYKESGVKSVSILGGSCRACRKLNGKVYTISDALTRKPIPSKECTTVLYDENRGFCMCVYLPQ